jgi:hypothetical protein
MELFIIAKGLFGAFFCANALFHFIGEPNQSGGNHESSN